LQRIGFFYFVNNLSVAGFVCFGYGMPLRPSLPPSSSTKTSHGCFRIQSILEFPVDVSHLPFAFTTIKKPAPPNLFSVVSTQGMHHLAKTIPRRNAVAKKYDGFFGWRRDGGGLLCCCFVVLLFSGWVQPRCCLLLLVMMMRYFMIGVKANLVGLSE
jgi:hypothetical protein